jgi:hypothetical protein
MESGNFCIVHYVGSRKIGLEYGRNYGSNTIGHTDMRSPIFTHSFLYRLRTESPILMLSRQLYKIRLVTQRRNEFGRGLRNANEHAVATALIEDIICVAIKAGHP